MVTNPIILRVDPGGHEADWDFHDARLHPRTDFSGPRVAPPRAADLPPDRRGRTARDALDGIRCGDAAFQRGLDDRALCDTACAGVVAVQPAAFAWGGQRS